MMGDDSDRVRVPVFKHRLFDGPCVWAGRGFRVLRACLMSLDRFCGCPLLSRSASRSAHTPPQPPPETTRNQAYPGTPLRHGPHGSSRDTPLPDIPPSASVPCPTVPMTPPIPMLKGRAGSVPASLSFIVLLPPPKSILSHPWYGTPLQVEGLAMQRHRG